MTKFELLSNNVGRVLPDFTNFRPTSTYIRPNLTHIGPRSTTHGRKRRIRAEFNQSRVDHIFHVRPDLGHLRPIVERNDYTVANPSRTPYPCIACPSSRHQAVEAGWGTSLVCCRRGEPPSGPRPGLTPLIPRMPASAAGAGADEPPVSAVRRDGLGFGSWGLRGPCRSGVGGHGERARRIRRGNSVATGFGRRDEQPQVGISELTSPRSCSPPGRAARPVYTPDAAGSPTSHLGLASGVPSAGVFHRGVAPVAMAKALGKAGPG